MPIQILRNDITKMNVDVIVNTSNKALEPGSGVNGAIHKAAGPLLANECRLLGGCETGQVKLTQGYDLPCKYVIHTVGPIWQGGNQGEKELLTACYRKALQLAHEKGCESIAFPLISTGVFGYPNKEALSVAMHTISDFLMDIDMDVYLVVFNKESVRISEKLFASIQEYIDDTYVEEHSDSRRSRFQRFREEIAVYHSKSTARASLEESQPADSVDDFLDAIDESFTQMVLRKIAEKGMTNAQCYKKANMDKKLFSKIKNDIHYQPTKKTAFALAIALQLSLDETRELLMKAGYAISHSHKFDIIIEYFIKNQNYDIFEINEALFSYDQELLGF